MTKRETAQTNEFVPSLFLLVKTVNLDQSTPKLFLPIIPIGIVAYAFTTFVETAVYVTPSVKLMNHGKPSMGRLDDQFGPYFLNNKTVSIGITPK